MRKLFKRILFTLILIVAVVAAGAALFYHGELKTLLSLKQVNSHPFYTMTYDGDYGFDDFLKQGAHNDSDIEHFVTKRLLKGIPFQFHVTKGGCSAFAARNEKGEALYGRNFDFEYTPAMLLKTKPKDGYASISMVNLSFAGYTQKNLPEPQRLSSFLTLAAPYLPFDGMNEKGLAVALLAVNRTQGPDDPKHVTLNTTTAIRLLLDKAATVPQAEALLKQYNLYFSAGIQCHYLIEDASGASVVAEYWDHGVQFVKSPVNYQAVTNFIQYKGLNIGEDGSQNDTGNEFKRYDVIMNRLKKSSGVIGANDAMSLLKSVSQKQTQWSVVYNLKTGSGSVCIANDYAHPYSFGIK